MQSQQQQQPQQQPAQQQQQQQQQKQAKPPQQQQQQQQGPQQGPQQPPSQQQQPISAPGQQQQQPSQQQQQQAQQPQKAGSQPVSQGPSQTQGTAGQQTSQVNPADGRAANEAAKQALMTALQKKRKVDKALADLEAKIWAFEGSYLEESSQTGGNIVKGFDGYLKPPTTGGAHKKKYEATEADRLFSSSSLTYQRALEARQAAGL